MADGFAQLPRVAFADLHSLLSSDKWELACEKLALSLFKHNACVLVLPEEMWGWIHGAMGRFCDLAPEDLQRLCSQDGSPGYTALPGRNRFDYRLGSGMAERLPEAAQQPAVQAYLTLDVLARLVLTSTCRASHVRLPTATLAGLLDEQPLARGAVSSSLMQVVQHTQNLSSPALRGARRQWLLAHQQDGAAHTGLLSLVATQEAQDCDRGAVSKLQVRDATGRWINVILQKNEVAIFLGATSTRATGGLLKAATTRVVGELVAGMPGQTQRCTLEFQLHARPDAVLDPALVLQEAGHIVQASFATPVAVRELMRQFDTVLTPLSNAAGPSSGSLEFGTFDPAGAAARKRQRKRLPMEVTAAAASSPVTRSGKVRRTSGGLVNGQPGPAEPQVCVSGEGGGGGEVNMERGGGGGEQVYITVDGGRLTMDFLRVRVVHCSKDLDGMGSLGPGVYFRISPHALASRLFEAYSQTQGMELSTLRFTHDTIRMNGALSLLDNGVIDEDEVFVSDFADPCEHMCASDPQPLACEEAPLDANGMRIVRGVIFDMDGTLTVPVIDFPLMRQRVGVPEGADILTEINSWPHERRVRGHEIIAEVEDQALADMAVAPGALELCAWLDRQSIPRALVTRNVARAVHHFHTHHFPHAPFHPAIDRDWGPWKPSPAALDHICQLWGIPPSEAVMVGDSAKDDVVSANRAGALSILLDAEGRYRPGGEALEGEAVPSHKVASLADAARVLRELYDMRSPDALVRAAANAPLVAHAAG
ncbi:hypothetical protein WJX81_002791 [Elliptochloris bilobata]|uniref:Uncharacterized protein n=1 Tax=Elliptochloris bilobata TaxID=381761 RepID=A0AAW1S828_9CHLO